MLKTIKNMSLFSMIMVYFTLIVAMLFTVTSVFSEEKTPEGVLRITWEIPTKDEKDNPFPSEEIKGFNLFYTLNDGEKEYAGWFDHKPEKVMPHYDFQAYELGNYCFTMETVSFNHGKSKQSDPVCYHLKIDGPDIVPTNPCGPSSIKVTKISI